MKKDNAGISLVELLIVISILAVLSGVGIYSFSQMSGYRARECSKKIATSIINNKVLTLGKAKSTGDICWELYKNDGNYFVRTVRNAGSASEYYEETEQVSKGKMDIFFFESGSGGAVTQKQISDSQTLRFCFNRSSGAICASSSPYGLYKLTGIRVVTGQRRYDIAIVPATGKVVQ